MYTGASLIKKTEIIDTCKSNQKDVRAMIELKKKKKIC